MPTQPAQTTQDDTGAQGLNPEIPPLASTEQPPQRQEDVSGVEADRRALERASVEELTASDGQVFKTLRPPQEPIPTQEEVQIAEQDPVHKIEQEIEVILQNGLVEIDKKANKMTGLFTELPPDTQKAFKEKGEALADDIVAAFQSSKLDPAQLQTDIKEWLRLIPGVNRPWLEQMATLKKDKIMHLYNQLKRDPNYLN
ncbi:hypothetical protein GF391_02090 [Candidatus Uhrbacteria bacterium]|nr:hypothetical protein [Candidatus Uhrbacteria bacterium]